MAVRLRTYSDGGKFRWLKCVKIVKFVHTDPITMENLLLYKFFLSEKKQEPQ